MLNSEDIQNLLQKFIEVFATREEVATKKDLEEINLKFDNLQTAVNAYAKRAEMIFQELLMLTQRVNRLEKWVQQITEKTGVKLESQKLCLNA